MSKSAQTTSTWGAIEPSESLQTRLRLDFGLRPAILAFNEMAVPGLGGAFFVRQLSWGCLGIRLAHEMGQPTMAAKIAEALEALASFIVQTGRGGTIDDRVQGKRKFKSVSALSFTEITHGGAYVTVPFRRATTAALPGLGFCRKAEARFNSLQLLEAGEALANAVATDRSARLLRNWIESGTALSRFDDDIKQTLLPGLATIAECELVQQQLLSDPRRKELCHLLQSEAMGTLETIASQSAFLSAVGNATHRAQLEACFSFERVRSAALQAGQAIVEIVRTGPKLWHEMAMSDDVRLTFDDLALACSELTSTLAQVNNAPAEITTFCNQQASDWSLEQRIKALAKRLPVVLSVLDHGVDKGFGYTDSLLAEDGVEATEGESSDIESAVPRPLLRLKRLQREIIEGLKNGAH